MLAKLRTEHREIIEAAETLLTLVSGTPRPSIDEVSQLRARIGTLALNHLFTEETLLIGPLLTSGRIDELPGGREALTENRELRAIYSNHIRDWTPQTIVKDWAGYTKALAELIDQLKIILAREEQYLHVPGAKLLHPEIATEAMRATG